VDFAYARTCRQQGILRYFGEDEPTRCGNCDICLEAAGVSRTPDEEEALIVRKALSGVARMSGRNGEKWLPRFGRGRIVQALVGSRSREIIQARLGPKLKFGSELIANKEKCTLSSLVEMSLEEFSKNYKFEVSKRRYPTGKISAADLLEELWSPDEGVRFIRRAYILPDSLTFEEEDFSQFENKPDTASI